jgi:hypothetical protein
MEQKSEQKRWLPLEANPEVCCIQKNTHTYAHTLYSSSGLEQGNVQ